MRLVVVSNRLPVTLKCTSKGKVQQASIEDFRGFFHRKVDANVVKPASPPTHRRHPSRHTTSNVNNSNSSSSSSDDEYISDVNENVIPRSSLATCSSSSPCSSPSCSSCSSSISLENVTHNNNNNNNNNNSNNYSDNNGENNGENNNNSSSSSNNDGDGQPDETAVNKTDDNTKDWTYTVSSGGLVSALTGLKNQGNMTFEWYGWPGTDVPHEDQDNVRTLISESNSTPVFLTDREADLHYNGFSNSVLWPLLHYQIPEMEGVYESFAGYRIANEKFAREIAPSLKDGDLVWVHDYHLMLLPVMLRRLSKKKFRIGFFLHTSFPSSDVFRMLPMRAELLEGVLGSDLIGFHTYDYARHFLSTCSRVLGLDTTSTSIKVNVHDVRVSVFPIGIEPEKFTAALQESAVVSRVAELRDKFKGRRVIVGVDRMDYIKGIPQKMMAYDRFLHEHPEMRSSVVLIQICVPSRQDVPEYQQLTAEVNHLVGKINGTFGTVDSCPIHFLHKSVTFPELVALYVLADACLVTSLRDGMNLVSYEYVASQKDTHGQLILSEFAGAAQSMDGAHVINPYNMEEVAGAIHAALTMGDAARKTCHAKLYQYVSEHTAATWGTAFVTELASGMDDSHAAIPELDIHAAALAFAGARKRVLFVDFDGALAKFTVDTKEGPSDAVLSALSLLSSIDGDDTIVYVISGRSRANMDAWFGEITDLGLVAEHGFYYKHPASVAAMLPKSPMVTPAPSPRGSAKGGVQSPFPSTSTSPVTPALGSPTGVLDASASPTEESPAMPAKAVVDASGWYTLGDSSINAEWMAVALPVLKYYSARTPGSTFDVKDASLTWHYRGADPEFGDWQGLRVRSTLENVLLRHPVEVVRGSRALEIRPASANRSSAISRITVDLAKVNAIPAVPAPCDTKDLFVMGISGHNAAGEDMHAALRKNFFGVTTPTLNASNGPPPPPQKNVPPSSPNSREVLKMIPGCFTCTVAAKVDTKAKYYIRSQSAALKVLDTLVQQNKA